MFIPFYFMQKNIPTIFIVFGATGDLMTKKIVPSLYYLHKNKELPKRFRVLGFSRRDYSDIQFRNHVFQILKKKKMIKTKKQAEKFLKLFHFQKGKFDKYKDYQKLGDHIGEVEEEWKVCANKLYYLAVKPDSIVPIVRNLEKSKLSEPCGGDFGWARFIIEKPFGSDGKSAAELERLLSVFSSEQVYRIDHYLGKEMVQGILNFRFSNNLLESSWSNDHIERIDIRLLEDIGVEDRGPFYESVGAFRDVCQNHLLEILALLTMGHPGDGSDKSIRKARAEILQKLSLPTKRDLSRSTYRAQYRGYRKIKGVNKNSRVETYAHVITSIDTPRWRGVPIHIEAGKRMGQPCKEVVVTFRHPKPCICLADKLGSAEDAPGRHFSNKVIFSIYPHERIHIKFLAKKPQIKPAIEQREFDFMLYKKKSKVQYVEEYAQLIVEAIKGDQTWFVSKNEVKAGWRLTDKIVKAWQRDNVPLHTYKPNTRQAEKSARKFFQSFEKEKTVGIIGLGRMGGGIAGHLLEQGWSVVGYNRTTAVTDKFAKEKGLVPAYSLADLVEKLPTPRTVWVMLPAGKIIDDNLFGKDGLVQYLDRGDTVIDGGNSFYKNTIKRGKKLKRRGINFLDCGVSGGPSGARNGACLMIGGKKKIFLEHENLFRDIAQANGHQFFSGTGAGHFVKMVHNGIEYGMMQAIGEGFHIMKKSNFKLDLTRIADIYNNGSVIESHLIEWLYQAFEIYGEDLKFISGKVSHSGEGEWTVKTAHEMGLRDRVIHEAFKFRQYSQNNPSYAGKIVSALRGQFGEHPVLKR